MCSYLSGLAELSGFFTLFSARRYGALRTLADLQTGDGCGGSFREGGRRVLLRASCLPPCGPRSARSKSLQVILCPLPQIHAGHELRNKSREVVALIMKANAARCGFPVSQTNRHLRLLLERGVAVTLIREQQRDWQQGIQVRAPVWRYCPVGCCSRKERGRIRIAYRDAGIVELYSARSDSAECRRSQKRGLWVSLVSTVLRGNPYRPL